MSNLKERIEEILEKVPRVEGHPLGSISLYDFTVDDYQIGLGGNNEVGVVLAEKLHSLLLETLAEQEKVVLGAVPEAKKDMHQPDLCDFHGDENCDFCAGQNAARSSVVEAMKKWREGGMKKRKLKLHFLNITADELPTKCLTCKTGVVVCCEKLFRELTEKPKRKRR